MNEPTPQQDQTLFTSCFNLPKVELHAHLNGCIRPITLLELAAARNIDTSKIETFDRSYESCMAYFSIAHQTIDNAAVLRRITFEMIQDYAKQNTIYLEIRSTIKYIHEGGNPDAQITLTKEEYLLTLLGAIEEAREIYPSLEVRLIVSIDRGRGVDAAKESLKLTQDIKEKNVLGQKYIVGIEFSGDPLKGHFKDYVKVFEEARESGLKIAVHTCEFKGQNEEQDLIVEFKPDRLGHCNYSTEEQYAKIAELQIPVEVCPTSNMISQGAYSMHGLRNFKSMREKGARMAICADDTGLFGINLSTELFELARAFKLSVEELIELEESGIQAIFSSDELKEKFKAEVQKFRTGWKVTTGELKMEDALN